MAGQPTWKKVIVSGSNAVLNQLEVTSGITGSLLGTSSYASFALSASYAPGMVGGTASYAETASVAVLANAALTASYVLAAGVSGKVATAGTADTASFISTLNQNVVITGSVSIKDSAADFSIVGNGFSETYLQGNGALVLQAGGTGVQVKSNNLSVQGNLVVDSYISASLAVTASGFKGDGSGLTGIVSATASLAHTASYVKIAESASFVLGSNVSGKVATAGTADTASYVVTALTASYYGGSVTSASYAGNASTADSATNATTAATASYVAGGNVDGEVATAGTADTASYVAGNNVVGAVANATNAATASYLPTITNNVTFQSNVAVQGNLTVDGTASFNHTTNLNVADQFILLNSGSNTIQDSGIIIASGSNSGTAFYLEVANTEKGRFAVATNVASDATAATAEAYAVTAVKVAGAPAAAPDFGGTSNGFGNIYVDSATGEIYIYA
jgi:hypothetical protein